MGSYIKGSTNVTDTTAMIVSYRTLRLFLGCLGIALPVALLIGGLWSECCVRPSISAYYHSPTSLLRDIFVGAMAAIGVFLICYKGHPKKGKDRISDNLIATAAGIGAIGIALFPTNKHSRVECWIPYLSGQGTSTDGVLSHLHNVSSLVFLLAIALLAGVRFARSDNRRRKTVYWICAGLIGACIVPIVIDSICQGAFGLNFDRYSVIFWLEGLAVWAFGAAWLTKGWPKPRDTGRKDESSSPV